MCTLRASGEVFDVDRFLERCPWAVAKIFRRGDRQGKKLCARSGFNLGLSDASWNDLAAQIRDVEQFIKKNRTGFRLLKKMKAELVLDFPVENKVGAKTSWTQEAHFPSPFVTLAGSLDLAIAISLYPVDDRLGTQS